MKSHRLSSLVRSGLLACCAALTGAGASAGNAVAAPPLKVLHYILPAAETSLDPVQGRDLYTGHITSAIFDTLYTYDYLARPVKLAPGAAAALPEVSADGRTYTIRLKHGIHFAPDAAFNGRRRELTMADYVYSWKRLFDPRLASPNTWLLEGKIIGLDQLAAEAKQSGRFDYDKPIAGFELLDPYTLRIHLSQTDFNLGMILAYEPLAAVAREVVARYGDDKGEVASNPVGTGFYRLTEWTRGSRLVLERNPEHPSELWNFQPGDDPDDQRIVRQMKGKMMPQIGRIEVTVQLEDQSRWLSFTSGEADLFWLDGPLAPKALLNGQLRPELAAKGIQLSRIVDPDITYYYWNMQDPVLGGYSKARIALRRAIAMAHDVDEEIALVLNGEGKRLEFPIPPGVVGYDPHYKTLLQYDPVLANQLLDRYGYKKGADGWRTQPDGSPLVIHYTSRNEASGVLLAEIWRKTYNALSIHMVSERMIFSDIEKAESLCKLQSRNYQWLADYPDGDNFMQLFYGPNVYQNNTACFKDPQYDAWYAASHKMPAGPERDALYHKMAREIEVYGVALIGYSRYRNMLAQPTVLGFKKHPILHQEWQYIDIDRSIKK